MDCKQIQNDSLKKAKYQAVECEPFNLKHSSVNVYHMF